MIYLDHAAATPVLPEVLKTMLPYFSDQFFNPSSPYLAAKKVREDYDVAKATLAHLIGAKAPDLIITSSATEAINLSFTALPATKLPNTHCLALSTEHPAVLATIKNYSHDLIKVSKTGLIDLGDLKSKLRPNTVLVSVPLADGELGTIQPLSEVSAILNQERQSRLKAKNPYPLYLHSDASQGLGLINISTRRLGVDLLTMNSAKLYGPKGIGALYVARNVNLLPVNSGGGQERGLRSGTENVPAMIGFAAAATLAEKHLNSRRRHFQALAQAFRSALSSSPTPPTFLGDQKHQLCNFCPLSFPGLDAERLIYLLEEREVYFSTGAACAASKGQKSHVLSSIGLSPLLAAGSLRITFGLDNTLNDIKTAASFILEAVSDEVNRMKA